MKQRHIHDEFKLPTGDVGIDGMAVSITLVFSDEAHREAWLENSGWLDKPGARTDYNRRKSNTNLMYGIGPIAKRSR
jgi:hypothetical protein